MRRHASPAGLTPADQILGTQMPIPGVKDPVSDPYIVLGADVAHPGPGSLSPSVAGVVGSFDINGGVRHAPPSPH